MYEEVPTISQPNVSKVVRGVRILFVFCRADDCKPFHGLNTQIGYFKVCFHTSEQERLRALRRSLVENLISQNTLCCNVVMMMTWFTRL